MMRNALVKLDLNRTLKENLFGREVGEYPRFFVTTRRHAPVSPKEAEAADG